MLIGATVAVSLIVTAAVDGNAISPLGVVAPVQMSLQQKHATLRPLVTSATDCIAHTVSADPRFESSIQAGDIRELIVDSMAPCLPTVRAMIETYDRLFGEGQGESFFMGPYLDVLPSAVSSQVKDARN
jgi:hypothetical protein